MYSNEGTVYEGSGESPQKEWSNFLYTIKAEALLHEQGRLQQLWVHLRNNEPELLDTFEFFLDNAVREIDVIRGDKDVALKSKEHSEREVQHIFFDVERILEEERSRIKAEYEVRYRAELERQIHGKQQELDGVVMRKKDLERQLAVLNSSERKRSESLRSLSGLVKDLSCKETELRQDNDSLQQENQRLQMQLSQSMDSLQRTQELCVRLQEKAESDKKEIFLEYESAVAQKDEQTRETVKLELELENLKVKLDEVGQTTHSPYHARLSARATECEWEQPNYETVVAKTPDRIFKVILVGDSNVGKSSAIQRFCFNTFSDDRRPTLDITFQMKTIVTAQGVTSLQIWDSAGQERFRSVPRLYFRKADGVMLLYDVTNETSLKNVRSWISNIKESAGNNAVIMLLGNKVDKQRTVTWEEGHAVALQCKAVFLEISAKSGENVPQAFEALTRILKEREEGDMGIPPSTGTPLGETIEVTSNNRTERFDVARLDCSSIMLQLLHNKHFITSS
nr:ras and EF-hand domain-containing protein-like [Ciona intestinalis]|eukprot:XP_018672428.1 ras and EF-hand domain-containing protein-like [Ciona intestinalis]